MVAGIDLAPTILDAVGLPQLPRSDGRSFRPVLNRQSQTGRDHVITHINRTAGKREFPMRSIIERRYGYIFNAWSNGTTVFRNESQAGLTMKAMKKAAASNAKIAARVQLFLKRVPEELYDYQSDPDAKHNLATDPQHHKTLARLRARLLEHMQSTDDPQLSAFTRAIGQSN
jgi:N-sulfoglucosamine sulfohydrolase